MGTRPSSFSSGGGYFSGAATIMSYRWTDDELTSDGPRPFTPGQYTAKDGSRKDKFRRLSVEFTILNDGATEPKTQFIQAGGAAFYRISEDGLSIYNAEEGRKCSPQKDSDLALLLSDIVKSGFPEENFDEDDTRVNLEALVGHRFDFTNARLTDKQVRDRKLNVKGREDKRSDHKGTFYPWTRVSVNEYLGVGNVKATPKANNSAKTAANGKAVEVDHQQAANILAEIVRQSGGSLKKGRLTVPLLSHSMLKGTNNPMKEPYKNYILENVDTLAQENGGSYDATSQTIRIN